MNSKIKYASITIAGLLLAIVAVLVVPDISISRFKKKITPDQIRMDANSRNLVTGAFMISPAGDGILSDGSGGACLVADLNPALPAMLDPQRRCSKNAECKDGLPSGWFGYCDINGDKSCWVRPGGANDARLCRKSPTAWKEGVWHRISQPFDVSVPNQNYPEWPQRVRWRVVACLNGRNAVVDPEDGTKKKPCALRDAPDAPFDARLEVFGKPSSVPPPPPPNWNSDGISLPDK